MIRRLITTAALSVALVAPLASHASIFGRSADTPSAVSSNAPKGKMIKLTLKNRTASPMSLYVNDQPVTLAANSEQQFKAAEGSDVLDADHTTVRVHVTSELNGNTVSFR